MPAWKRAVQAGFRGSKPGFPFLLHAQKKMKQKKRVPATSPFSAKNALPIPLQAASPQTSNVPCCSWMSPLNRHFYFQ